MTRYRLTLFALCVALPLTILASPTATDDAADAFSLVSNPNGTWQYGTTGTELGGAFSPFANNSTNTFQNANVSSWYGDESMFGDNFPLIGKNASTTTQNVSTGDIVLRPMELFAHPGPSGTFSVLRYTAQGGGQYTVSGRFEGRDQRGVSTDVHVLVNSVAIASGVVNGFGAASQQWLSTVITLQPGDTVDFAVGVGANENFENDSTGIAATVTPASGVGVPTSKDQCKDGHWQTFASPRVFKNQGDCVRFVTTGK